MNIDNGCCPSMQDDYFVIDSYTCRDFESALFGYAIVDSSVRQSIDQLPESLLRSSGGMGAYVSIWVDEDKITVTQDFLGSYGLYLYRDGEYFALSNSFLRLVEYLQDKRTLTLNDHNAKQFLASDIISFDVTKTLVNEIELLWRNAVVIIDKRTLSLSIGEIDYGENTIPIDSREGIKALDDWYDTWTASIKTFYSSGNPMVMDISGGMDSRMNLCLFLGSGIDLRDVQVNSIDDTLHTHKDDLIIANQLADYYHFQIETVQQLFSAPKGEGDIELTVEEGLAASLYAKGTIHKQFIFQTHISDKCPVYYFGGNGGECLRDYWHMPLDAFLKKMSKYSFQFGEIDGPEIWHETESAIRGSLLEMQEHFARFGRLVAGPDLVRNLFRESYCRYHFGRIAIEGRYGGKITISPLLDKSIHRLRVDSGKCKDPKLLMAVLFDRYQSELLDFAFDGGRTIDPATIEYARRINKQFPRSGVQTCERSAVVEESSSAAGSGSDAEKMQASIGSDWLGTADEPGLESPLHSAEELRIREIDDYLYRCFLSSQVRCMVERIYGYRVYRFIQKDIENRRYFQSSYLYTILPVAAVAYIISADNVAGNVSMSSYLAAAAKQRVDTVKDALSLGLPMAQYYRGRIDLKCVGEGEGDGLGILSKNASTFCNAPEWFRDESGQGFCVENSNGYLSIMVEALRDSIMTVGLRGPCRRGDDGENLPLLIDFVSVKKDGEELLDSLKTVWHNEPFTLEVPVEAGEQFLFEAWWQPHNPHVFL